MNAYGFALLKQTWTTLKLVMVTPMPRYYYNRYAETNWLRAAIYASCIPIRLYWFVSKLIWFTRKLVLYAHHIVCSQMSTESELKPNPT